MADSQCQLSIHPFLAFYHDVLLISTLSSTLRHEIHPLAFYCDVLVISTLSSTLRREIHPRESNDFLACDDCVQDDERQGDSALSDNETLERNKLAALFEI